MAESSSQAVVLSKSSRQRNNENAAKFFAATMAGIIMVIIISHWTRVLFKRQERNDTGVNGLLKRMVVITRIARKALLRKVPVFLSLGHVLILAIYIAATFAIALTNMDWSLPLNNVAKRLGWLSASNLALVTFLSLRNTPLAFLTNYSYENLRPVHKIAGYCFVVFVILHAAVYVKAFVRMNLTEELIAYDQIFGIVAGLSVLIMVAAATLLRRMQYELFYFIHVTLFMLVLIMVGFHRPDLTKKTVIIVIFSAGIWVADRAIRFLKLYIYGIGNTATLQPLPHGGTKVILRRAPKGTVPGSHCFFWVPGIRAVETHPFTVASTNPLEFVIASYDGFTRDLQAAAVKNPGQTMRASVEGPYGKVPDLKNYTRVILIAGGSGASFTFGVAIDLLHKLGASQTTLIDFIWTVRDQDMLEWFEPQMKELAASQIVNLCLFSTRGASESKTLAPNKMPYQEPKDDTFEATEEKSSTADVEGRNRLTTPVSPADIEKQLASPALCSELPVRIQSGRPRVTDVISDVVQRSADTERIIVAACGPDGLMSDVRAAVVKNIKIKGPSIEYHAEQFGW